MKLKNEVITLPSDIDAECIDICNTLNSLPETETFESCCGHLRYRFSVWFFCYSIDVLSRLGRAVERNYSDGKWEIVVDSTDTYPNGVFWLRSKEPFKTEEEMRASVNNLIGNINHWVQDAFDEYFSKASLRSLQQEQSTHDYFDEYFKDESGADNDVVVSLSNKVSDIIISQVKENLSKPKTRDKKFSELKAGDSVWIWWLSELYEYGVQDIGFITDDGEKELLPTGDRHLLLKGGGAYYLTKDCADSEAFVWGTDGWHEYKIIGTSKEAVKKCLVDNINADLKKLEKQTLNWLSEF